MSQDGIPLLPAYLGENKKGMNAAAPRPNIQFLPRVQCLYKGKVTSMEARRHSFGNVILSRTLMKSVESLTNEGNWRMRGCSHISTHSESRSVGLSMPLTMGRIPIGVLWFFLESKF